MPYEDEEVIVTTKDDKVPKYFLIYSKTRELQTITISWDMKTST